ARAGSQPGHCSSWPAWLRPGPGTQAVPGPGWPALPPAGDPAGPAGTSWCGAGRDAEPGEPMAHLHVPVWGWVAVVGGLALLLCADFVASPRRPSPVRMSQAAGWTLVTVLLAVGFGALLAVTSGGTPAGQFF